MSQQPPPDEDRRQQPPSDPFAPPADEGTAGGRRSGSQEHGSPGPGSGGYGSPEPETREYRAPGYGSREYGSPEHGGPASREYGAPPGSREFGAAPYTPYGTPPVQQSGNGVAVASLVLGILAVLGFLLGPVAVVLALVALLLGVLGRRKAKRGAKNGGLAVAGLVLGGIGLLLGGFMTLAYGALFSSSEFGGFAECVQQATTQAEAQQCAEQFSGEVR